MCKISVIIPCFNQGKYLNRSIESVIQQTYTSWEVILVNDGSFDETAMVGKEWERKDSRINYFHQHNAGLSAARNFGISKATGDVIALLDADDLYEKEYLAAVASAFKQGASLTFSGYWYFVNDEESLYSVKIDTDTNFKQILSGNILPPVAVAFRKSILNVSGLFDVDLKSAEDWDLWIRFYKMSISPVILSSCFVRYRVVADSMSRNAFRMYDALKEVAYRAVKPDNRLPENLKCNQAYSDIDPAISIKRSLVMCLGVSVMQGKVNESIELFKKETDEYKYKWAPADFKAMCSYLSFRYQFQRQEIGWLLLKVYPAFKEFFRFTGLSEEDQKKAIKEVFSRQIKLNNRYRWGMLGRIINLFV